MKDKFIEMKDFIMVISEGLNKDFEKEIADKIVKLGINYAINIDEEKCLKWLKQAQEIETYSVEQVQDLKIKHLLDKKDEEIKALKTQIAFLKCEVLYYTGEDDD